MDNKEKTKLKGFAFEVIEEEGLSKPKEIKFRAPLFGAKRKYGTIYRDIRNGDFIKIIITTTKERFLEDDNGIYRDKATGQCYRRGYGVPLDNETIIMNMAHEIAHLKIWRHGISHRSYTQHILRLLKKKYEVEENGNRR